MGTLGRETPSEVVFLLCLRAAFDENLTSDKHPQNGIPAYFVFNTLLIFSNGTAIPARRGS
jgi:hypothetical protein